MEKPMDYSDYEKRFLYRLLASEGASQERKGWAFNRLCAKNPRMIFSRRINFWKNLAETAHNKWRRKIARHMYRHYREKFLVLDNLGLL